MDSHIKDAKEFARAMKGGNPVRSSLLLLLIIAFLAIAVIWAAKTELDTVTRGDGRIVPAGEVQVVQPSEPGVIADIHVSDGDVVAAGDPLVTLDGTQIAGELAQLETRIRAFGLRIARLRAEIDGTAYDPGTDTPQAASERALFQARKAALDDEIRVLEVQAGQRQQEVTEAQGRVGTAETALALIDEEIALIAPLVEAGVEPRTSLIGLEVRRTEAFGRLSEARSQVMRAQSAADEITDRMTSVRSAYRATAIDNLVTTEAELAELRAILPTVETRLTRAVLVAPARGVVNRVLATTRGALARAGEPLVEIVPLDDTLLVEAYLTPADVAFVRAGQDVRVNITAYDPSRYGAIDGRILRIGADAVTRPDRDEQAFMVEIETLSTLEDAAGVAVDILPGMVAQVDILSGKRSVLDYLISPVIRVRETAFRE